jgi:hypothetical protein
MARGKYGTVEARFWDDQKLQRLGNNARLLMLYLLTCRHRNMVGSFRLPVAYLCADIGWSRSEFDSVWERIQADDRPVVFYDEDEMWMCIRNFVRQNPPVGIKSVTGCANTLDAMPDNPHNDFVIQQLVTHSADFAKVHQCTINAPSMHHQQKRDAPSMSMNNEQVTSNNEQVTMTSDERLIEVALKSGEMHIIDAIEIDRLKHLHPSTDVHRQLKLLAEWNQANPSKRKTKSGIKRHINHWLSNSKPDTGGTIADGNKRALATVLASMERPV